MTTDGTAQQGFQLHPDDHLARRRLVVIGGGLVGNATAYAAARMGGDAVQVELFEAAAVGHAGGASIDINRVLRHAHGDEAHYTRWAMEAVRLWREVEQRSERELFQQTGLLWMLHADDQPFIRTGMERPLFGSGLEFLRASERTMRAHGLRCEMIDGAELRRRYPVYADPTLGTTLVEHEAGAIQAADAVLALRDLARGHGVTIHERKRAARLHPKAGACAVEFADGSSVEADTVVLAVNGWTATLLPDLDDRLRPRQAGADGRIARGLHNTEQPVYHVVPRADAFDQFLPERFPIAAFMNRRVNVFPTARGAVKVASDDGSRHIGLPEERQLASVEYREELFAYAEAQIPALRGAALVQERVCFYDRSPDDDFILDQWDPHARLIVACGFSGHGFKFGPLLGDRLARYALTAQRPDDLHHFSFARFAQGAPAPSEATQMP